MERPKSVHIRYTAKFFPPVPPNERQGSSFPSPFFTYSQDDQPLDTLLQDNYSDSHAEPVLEIVTSFQCVEPKRIDIGAGAPEVLRNVIGTSQKTTLMMIHSAVLSQIVKDTVKHYPRQSLHGKTIVIQEPYAVLMHHLTDLENFMSRIKTVGEHLRQEADTHGRVDLEILLNFVRPKFQQWCESAQQRLLQKQPTVTFDDLWFLMKPGSLAYTECDGCWIGCRIEETFREEVWEKGTTKQGDGEAQTDTATCILRRSVLISLLRASPICSRLDPRTRLVLIDQYDGEKQVSSLPIFPREFFDRSDSNDRRAAFEERGARIMKMVWAGSHYARHRGYCLSDLEFYYDGPVVISPIYGEPEEPVNETHYIPAIDDWIFTWKTPYKISGYCQRDTTNERLDPQTNASDTISKDRLFLISPQLRAFALKEHLWIPIHIENIQDVGVCKEISEPTIRPEDFKLIEALVDLHRLRESPQSTSIEDVQRPGVKILLHGAPGVGKTHTIEMISERTRRPILSLNVDDFYRDGPLGKATMQWFLLAEKWKAILLIDYCDALMRGGAGQAKENSILLKCLDQFQGLLFLTSNQVGIIDEVFRARITLSLYVAPLDDTRRNVIWKTLLRQAMEQGKSAIEFSASATKFLQTDQIHSVDWNGHEIVSCFQTATSLAILEAKKSPSYAKDAKVIVDVDQFKEALNRTYAFREYVQSISGMNDSARARNDRSRNDWFGKDSGMGMPPPPPQFVGQASRPRPPEAMMPHMQSRPGQYLAGKYPETVSNQPASRATFHPSSTTETDMGLCSPDLNRVQWQEFKDAAPATSGELFRKTKFHAIDVLVGEPSIMFKVGINRNKKRKATLQKGATHGQTQSDSPIRLTERIAYTRAAGEGVLPERIRINSLAIRKAFEYIHDKRQSGFGGPFLVFRPFRSLSHYEQDFREALSRLEDRVKSYPSDHSETQPQDMSDDPAQPEDSLKHIHDTERASLQEMRALLDFIDKDIKQKKEFIHSPRCQSVSFGDIWFLFKPGDLVIAQDSSQAYKVIKVTVTRHQVKPPKKRDMSYWRDDTEASFEDNPLRVHCVYIDFDGTWIGPVIRTFSISRFQGEEQVVSLPVYPLRFSTRPNIYASLVERGNQFVRVAAMKHMHYSGLTLDGRDDVDSQVVVDFEEALSRNPDVKPRVESVIGEDFKRQDTANEGDNDPGSSSSSETESDTSARARHVRRRHSDRSKSCVEECCAQELCHHDDYVENRRMQEYVAANMNTAAPGVPSLIIHPRRFADIVDKESLSEDELLIMSRRVFGFVMRSRKWAALDLDKMTEVTGLGDENGFDQLVLPSGHKDMVKSLIRQHLRDKKSEPVDNDQMDIVRGKGKGLIMLLHGVPGVGKTSTAECVADSFKRPLFQITSGDLGTTAREVEEALETNFSLANRWDCVLLIDEADVFLVERSKDDFVRNSLVSVFLRVLEYYSGVLFLTTNRVGVFDEAFTSRIHISLYYPPLDRDPTHQVFEKNMQRIKDRYRKRQKPIEIHESEITKFALDYFDENKQGRWNGRQIRNAFQTALALAELEAHGEDDETSGYGDNKLVKLGRSHFETVAAAYKGFMEYLNQTYGADVARRARENLWRSDTFGMPRAPNPLTTRLPRWEPRPAYDQWRGPQYPQDYSYDRGDMPYRAQQSGHHGPEDYRYQPPRGGRDPGPPGHPHRPAGPLSAPMESTYPPGPGLERHDLPRFGRSWVGESRMEAPEGEHRPSYAREPAYDRGPGAAYPPVKPES